MLNWGRPVRIGVREAGEGAGACREGLGPSPLHRLGRRLGVGTTLLCPHWGLLLLDPQNPRLLLETVMSLAVGGASAILCIREKDHRVGVEGVRTKNWDLEDWKDKEVLSRGRRGCWAPGVR